MAETKGPKAPTQSRQLPVSCAMAVMLVFNSMLRAYVAGDNIGTKTAVKQSEPSATLNRHRSFLHSGQF